MSFHCHGCVTSIAWTILVGAATTGPAMAAQGGGTNHAPTVQLSLQDGTWYSDNREIVIRVTIDDADGDRVSANLALAPAMMTMRPIVDELPPVTREIRWYADNNANGRQRVVVHAHDAVAPTVIARGETKFDVIGVLAPSTQLMDVDGDDDPEVVTADAFYNVHGKPDAGAIVVFDLGKAPGPSGYAPQILRSRTPTALAHLGRGHQLNIAYFDEQVVQQADLNGDGVLDLVALSDENGGTLHVWFGGASSVADRRADATLTAPTTPNFGTDGRSWLLFHDVTGDGVDDVIAVAPLDSTVALESGAIHVFAGGPSFGGAMTPTATLRLLNAQPLEHLGGTKVPSSYTYGTENGTQCVLFHDVTGDGIDDVVAAAPSATRNGVQECGIVGVWAGGATLSGTVLPTAELLAPNPSANDRLGANYYTDCAAFGDVDGDGVDDVVVPALQLYNSMGGRIYVWKGGASLQGTPLRRATLAASGCAPSGLSSRGLFVTDFDGDGVADVIGWSSYVSFASATDAGAGFLFSGGAALRGVVTQTATLTPSLPQKKSELGNAAHGVRLVDVDGDGVRDLVVASPNYDAGGARSSGAIHVWKGGVARHGTSAPDAELAPRWQNDQIGFDDGEGFRVADVTGDGQVDLIVPMLAARDSPANDGRVPGSYGAIAVFEGGSALSGSVFPIARLEHGSLPGIADFDDLVCEDVTGDGIADVIAADPYFGLQPFSNMGALFVWQGGAAMRGHPASRAEFYGGFAGDYLAWGQDYTNYVSYHRGIACADVTGDGILDVLIGSAHARVGATNNAGAGQVLEGGARLNGRVTAWSTLARRQPNRDDRAFGTYLSYAFQIGDLDGDGVVDWLAPDAFAQVGGHSWVGALLWYPGAKQVAGGGAIELTTGQNDAGHRFGL